MPAAAGVRSRVRCRRSPPTRAATSGTRQTAVFRAYGHDESIVDAVLVPADHGQEEAALGLLGRADVAFVHSRNVLHGCYMFELRSEPSGG